MVSIINGKSVRATKNQSEQVGDAINLASNHLDTGRGLL